MEFEIRSQNLQETMEQVERIRQRMPWYQEHGYKIAFPADTSEEEVRKTLAGAADRFERAAASIRVVRGTLDACVERLEALPWFRLPAALLVRLSPYGVGGSYRVDEDVVILKVRDDGTLVNPPAQAVMHELVHLGVQKGIVEAFDLSHAEKEALVDGICLALLPDLLPGYQAQARSDAAMLGIVETHMRGDLLSAIRDRKRPA